MSSVSMNDIPSANLVNALLDLLVQNSGSLGSEPLPSGELDRGYLQGARVTLDEAVTEMTRRWQHMPPDSLITEELRRRREASGLQPVMSSGKDW